MRGVNDEGLRQSARKRMSLACHKAHNSHPNTAPAQIITTQQVMVMTPPTSAERCDSIKLLGVVDAASSNLLRVLTLWYLKHAISNQKSRHKKFAASKHNDWDPVKRDISCPCSVYCTHKTRIKRTD